MSTRARPRRAGSCAGLAFILLLGCFTTNEGAPRGVPVKVRQELPREGMPLSSAGVFIGIERFPLDALLTEVRYAVNDAVDLAYALSVEQGLLPTDQVLLLLSGEPEGDSTERLRILEAKGARRFTATQADIYSHVERQSRNVEEGGLFVLSIATHGYSEGAEQLLLSSDSLSRYRMGVRAETLLKATSDARGLRLLIVDACREQVFATRGPGSPKGPDPRSAMPLELVKTLTGSLGYAVFSAASPGGYAYPGDHNGLFTGAILEGLQCKAPVDDQGFVTLTTLGHFVRERVDTLSHGQQQPELRLGGGVGDIALVRCGEPPKVEPARTSGLAGMIVEPRDQAKVWNPGVVRVSVTRPGLYAVAVILAESNGIFYRQQPNRAALPATSGVELRIPVDYGAPGRFQVYVGLSPDPNFLLGEDELTGLPPEDSHKNPVQWLGPVHVILPEH